MKTVFVGGGSFRTLPVVRSAMAKSLYNNGEICLCDFNLFRAESVSKLIKKSPEFAGTNCKITFTDKLEKALPGTDAVSISMPVGSYEVCTLSDQACLKKGFIGGDQISITGDQISVSGAFRSLTGGKIVLDVARKMEIFCPEAVLIDFANPVAVYSGLVNNHTKIRALGICGGYANHRWDLTRIIDRKDEYCDKFKVVTAGINHLSFILRGSYRGEDIYKLLGEAFAVKKWRCPELPSVSKTSAERIAFALKRLRELYFRTGYIIYSTEGDGMAHMFMDEYLKNALENYKPQSIQQIKNAAWKGRQEREKADREFRRIADSELDSEFWSTKGKTEFNLAPAYSDLTVPVLEAISGKSSCEIVASYPNHGAVKGFKDRTVLEYSMTVTEKGITPFPDMEVPDCFHGLISSLATHQTLLGDAIAANDPKIFADALFAYPVKQNTKQARALFRELLLIHKNEIDPVFQQTKDYLLS